MRNSAFATKSELCKKDRSMAVLMGDDSGDDTEVLWITLLFLVTFVRIFARRDCAFKGFPIP